MTYKNKDKLREYKQKYSKTPQRILYLKNYNKLNRMKLNKYKKDWRLKNLTLQREYHAKWMRENKNEEYKKQWNLNNKIWYKNWAISNKDKVRKASKKAYWKNPLVAKVRVYTRIKFKKEANCGICKSDNNLQFHHWKYQMPVESKHFSTLCSSCHNIQHGGLK